MARAHFVEAVLLRLYRLDDPVPFLLYVVDLVCLVLHVRVVNITVFCYGLVSDPFVRPWLGRTWFLETVCTLYYHLVPRRAESKWSVLSFDETLSNVACCESVTPFFPFEMHGRCPNYSRILIEAYKLFLK